MRDVSDGTNYAEHTVVLKVNGDLTVKEGVTLTSVKSGNYGGPKGMIVYCTGTLKNDGDISMSYRGGYAEGQNVYLYKNSNENYEFIPKLGSGGGAGTTRSSAGLSAGGKGLDAVGRGTGGGSGGSIIYRGVRRRNQFKWRFLWDIL